MTGKCMFDALVFDFDGVLADSVSVKTRAFEKLYASYGREVSDKVVQYHCDNGGMPRAEKFRYYQVELLGETVTDEDLTRLSRAFSLLVVDEVVAAPEIKGAGAFLRSMHGIVPLYVDSASPDGELRQIVERRGLSHFFAGVYGSGRTKAENLESILARNGFSPDRVCFFGDALSDYRAAELCGTAFIGIGGEDSPLAPVLPAQLMCRDFIEVTAYFERNTK